MAIGVVLSACAAPMLPPPMQVRAESFVLQQEAETALIIGDNTAPILNLTEQFSHTIESLAADGTASAYKAHYVLTFQFDNAEQRQIVLEQIISVDESRYLAARHIRDAATNQLRLQAIRQMRSHLSRTPQ